MADTVSEKRRSEIMSHIKSKNTKIELLVRKELFARGFRYRVNYKALPGKPDIVFTKQKVAVFIHGCFWHGHEAGCRYSHIPQSRKEYWEPKIARTKERDQQHMEWLAQNGWRVLVFWECKVKKDLDAVTEAISNHLSSVHQHE